MTEEQFCDGERSIGRQEHNVLLNGSQTHKVDSKTLEW